MLTYGGRSTRKGVFTFMQFLIPVLVSLLVLPLSAISPVASAKAPTPVEIASTTPVAQLPAPKLTLAPAPVSLTTKLTAYNAVPGQTDNNPFTTAIGAFSNPEVVAARSGDLAYQLPYGTVIAIERAGYDTPSCGFSQVESQIGYRVIADAMNPRITNTIDVLLDQKKTVPYHGYQINPGRALGLCGQVTIKVIGRIAVKDIPATQAELAAMVNQSTELALR
jgi:3D (Asp-Asp-Asp) domain-containing protein